MTGVIDHWYLKYVMAHQVDAIRNLLIGPGTDD